MEFGSYFLFLQEQIKDIIFKILAFVFGCAVGQLVLGVY
jgi:hypothetical protein